MGERVNHGRSLRQLGREVADELDVAPVDPAITRARARLFEGEEAPLKRRGAYRFQMFGGLALTALAGLSIVMLRFGTMRFSVGEPPAQGSIGAWVATPSGSPNTIRFEDGARFELGPSARARVVSARAGSATLELASGELSGDVSAAQGDATFRVTAGPFEGVARQARFQVRWDAEGEVLKVESSSGSVVVTGPSAPAGMSVAAGEGLRASVREGRIELE